MDSTNSKPNGPWLRDHATVHLSKRRCALLRLHADSQGASMTPVEAIYDLIDRSGDVRTDKHSKPQSPGTQSDEMVKRLDAMSRQSEANALLAQESNSALKAVAEVLGPIHALVETMAKENSETSEEESKALEGSSWISSVMSKTQSQGKNQIAVQLGWRKTELAEDQTMEFIFTATTPKRTEIDSSSFALPALRVSGLPIQWQAIQTLSASSTVNLFLICSREGGGRWQGLIVAVGPENERERVLSFLF